MTESTNSERLKGLQGGEVTAAPSGPVPWDKVPSASPPPAGSAQMDPPPLTATGASAGLHAESVTVPVSLPAPTVSAPANRPRNGKGTASLVLGIVGLLPLPIIGFWCPIIAIILGSQGKRLADRGWATNHGVAQAGFVLGIIGVVFHVFLALGLALSRA